VVFDSDGGDRPGDDLRSRPAYFIGVVAEITEIHPQTLRHYERIGLLTPSRSPGNVRMFSQEDIERVRLIQRLTSELGVNLAGVEVVLNMRDRYQRQAAEHQRNLRELRGRYEAEIERLRNALRRATQDPGAIPPPNRRPPP
jgi:MerR family transcriptional regulator/heat shock protein HspR